MNMLLYTIVPLEIIYEEAEGASGTEEQIVERGNVRLLVRADGVGGATVNRILSTDPQDYLDRRWQPGSRIKL